MTAVLHRLILTIGWSALAFLVLVAIANTVKCGELLAAGHVILALDRSAYVLAAGYSARSFWVWIHA